jgi:hypothetical protein
MIVPLLPSLPALPSPWKHPLKWLQQRPEWLKQRPEWLKEVAAREMLQLKGYKLYEMEMEEGHAKASEMQNWNGVRCYPRLEMKGKTS